MGTQRHLTWACKSLTCWQVMLALHEAELLAEVAQHLLLRLLLAHQRRHLLAQVPHQKGVDFAGSHPLHKFIYLHSKAAPVSAYHAALIHVHAETSLVGSCQAGMG